MPDQTSGFNAASEFGPGLAPAECVLRHVSRASRAVVAAYDPALAPFDITGHQFNLMMTLNERGPLSVGDLAEALGMDASGVPRAIRPLQQRGFIEVAAGADRRRRVLSITGAGHAKLAETVPAWRRVQAELVEAVGADRWSQLQSDLRRVRAAALNCSTRRSPGG